MNINFTLIGQSITFALFVWFCFKFIWPPIIQAMRERQKQIADGLASAERAEKDLETAKGQIAEELNSAKDEAQSIVEQARQRANQMIEDAREAAREEGERVKDSARADIEQEINRAREQLRSEVAALAVAGATRILEEDIDRDKHAAMLDRLATEL